jgi:hypothetical protein
VLALRLQGRRIVRRKPVVYAMREGLSISFWLRERVMARYTFKSSDVESYAIERTCNKWAEEGFVVFSVVCPDPENYITFRITARRDNEADYRPRMFEETEP